MSVNSWRKTALVMSVLAVCGMCGCENRSSGDEDRQITYMVIPLRRIMAEDHSV